MDIVLLARQALLFAHLLAFAIAFTEVVRGDLRLLTRFPKGTAGLDRIARTVSVALVVLWITGLGLVGLETGFDPAVIAAKAKLATKLIVVGVLTLNGVLLHRVAFPTLRQRERMRPGAMLGVTLLGATSTVSWIYAGFLGVGRIIAPQTTFVEFVGLYVLALAAGLLVAGLVVAPLLTRRLARNLGQVGLLIPRAWLATWPNGRPILAPNATSRSGNSSAPAEARPD